MRMEQYLTFTDYALWEVIVNDDSVTVVASASAEGPIPPKTTEQKLARKNKLKAKSTLMLAILDEHLLKFYAYKDAKSLWETIKNRFGGNKESKKMQKTILKQNYENFEDANLKLRSLPLAWNNIALILRNKFDLDTLSMDDLHNNIKVYESEIKGQSSSSSNYQNVAFVSSDNTSTTNETVNIAHNVSAASSKDQASTESYADDSFLAEEELTNFALMYDQQRETLNKSNLEIIGYQIRLDSIEARIVVHEKNEAVYEEDITFLKYNVQVKDISIKDLKNQLENALKDKDDLKHKLEKFETSFKNLTKLIDSQISATNKTGLGYDGHVNESEVLNNVVDSYKNDGNDNQINDRFKKSEGYHAVPPLYIGSYIPPKADLSFARLDDIVFKSKESTSEDENVFEPKEVKKIVKPSLEKIEFVNARNTTVQNENKAEKPRKFSQSPRVLTKSRKVPVNTAKQSSQRAASSVSTARHVNTATSRPNVNSTLPITYSYFKAHSPVRRPFNKKSAAKTNNFNEKVNTAKVNNVTTFGPKAVVSAARGNRNNAVKSSTCWIWRPKGNIIVRNKKITTIENQMDHKVKTIRCDNRTEFKNKIINEFCEIKGNQTNGKAGTKANIDAGQAGKKTVPGLQYVLLPLLTTNSQGLNSLDDEVADDAIKKSTKVPRKENGVKDLVKKVTK
nr:ribonuclease H-like domain-containing protein [Tanacetum cinerariifolium]